MDGHQRLDRDLIRQTSGDGQGLFVKGQRLPDPEIGDCLLRRLEQILDGLVPCLAT
jgi:hypothetical protein